MLTSVKLIYFKKISALTNNQPLNRNSIKINIIIGTNSWKKIYNENLIKTFEVMKT